MSTLKGFFKESDTPNKVLTYPKHYLIAVFCHLAAARQAVAEIAAVRVR